MKGGLQLQEQMVSGPVTRVHCGCSELQMLSYDDVTTIGGSHMTDDS